MRQLLSFTKKEFLELFRTGKWYILLLLFTLFGIMNPAIAKLTPWLMEMLSESLADAGMTITEVEITALTSWTQFYKNIPMALIIFIVMFSGMLTNEYQKGSLINILTKGMKRWKIIIAKAIVSISMWTLCYWLCYGITFIYNAYFWDNSIATHPFFAAFCLYLLGIWFLSLMLLLSSICTTNSSVLIGTALIFGCVYLMEWIPNIREYLPTYLMISQSILSKGLLPKDFIPALLATAFTTIGALLGAIFFFNKKSI